MSGRPQVVSRRRATAWPQASADLDTAGAGELAPATVYRFVMGVDSEPTVMSPSQLEGLADPMGMLLRQGKFPLTVHDLLAEIDAVGTLPLQRSYLISEAGQIPPSMAGSLERDMRFAITRARAANVDLLVSTSAIGAPAEVFLQVLGWDEAAGRFNYYMRLDRSWVWAGDSYSALAPESRGQGCFDSHVNGSLVMKELKQPWLHWQSMNATILLARDDPLRASPLYRSASGAEDLELTVRAGVSRWTHARLRRAVTAGGQVTNLDHLLRQLCTTTTVNLASSVTASGTVASNPDKPLTLPLGFWLNVDVLLNDLGIPARFVPPSVPGQLYLDSLARYDFALVEGEFRQRGDAFFAFAVPEAAFEDNEVVNQLVRRGMISAHFAASVLMVDFPNPVFSPARAQLLSYVPATAVVDPAGDGVSQQVAVAIVQAAEGLPAPRIVSMMRHGPSSTTSPALTPPTMLSFRTSAGSPFPARSSSARSPTGNGGAAPTPPAMSRTSTASGASPGATMARSFVSISRVRDPSTGNCSPRPGPIPSSSCISGMSTRPLPGQTSSTLPAYTCPVTYGTAPPTTV